jgi:hypothetical protein
MTRERHWVVATIKIVGIACLIDYSLFQHDPLTGFVGLLAIGGAFAWLVLSEFKPEDSPESKKPELWRSAIKELSAEDKQERRILFEQFLRCIDREENLIHFRMQWGFQWNAAFFTAVIVVHNASSPDVGISSSSTIEASRYGIYVFLSCLGLVASAISFIGIKAAHTPGLFSSDYVTA